MRNLINFLLKNSSWFVFIFLEIVCFSLIFNGNSYQKSVFLTSSNELTGRVYSISGSILSYFGLQQENQDLLKRNAELEARISELKDRIFVLEADSVKTTAFLTDSLIYKKERPIVARVEKNSISLIDNYIIVNRGKNDGVKPDMSAVSEQGLVGLVRTVSANYAIIQPILNPHSRISCKIMDSKNAAGILIWETDDPRYASLTEYPKYEKIAVGDTIITSGFSDFFPEGIFVGTVESYKSETDDNFYRLKVRLATEFGSLKNVMLINKNNQEIKELESKVKNVKK